MSVVSQKADVSVVSDKSHKPHSSDNKTGSRTTSRATGALAGGMHHMATIHEKGGAGGAGQPAPPPPGEGMIDAQCQICSLRGKHRGGSYYCTTCNMPLCQACSGQHKATKVTAEHALIQKKDKTPNEQVCAQHRFAAVQYYCDDCARFVCVNCTMLEHRAHKVVEIGEKAGECRLALGTALRGLDAKIAVVRQESRKAQDAETEIRASREKLAEDTRAKTEAIICKIKVQEEAMLRSVDSYMDAKLDLISSRKEMMHNKFEDMMAVRMVSDLKSGEMSHEKFILDAIDAQAKMAKIKEEEPMDETEMKRLKLIFTNNGDLGRVEASNEPLFRYRTLKHLPKHNTRKIHNGGGSTHRSSSDYRVMPALDLTDGDSPSPRAALMRKDYQTVKMTCKFRTTSFVAKPAGLAVLPNGRFVIADAESNGLVIADKTGRFQQRVFQEQITCPQGVCLDKKGHVYVTTERYVKKFKVGGGKLGQFNAYPTPGAIQVDSQGRMVVSDVRARHVTIYDEDGKALTKFYTTDKMGNAPDAFNLAVHGEQIALSYQSLGISHFVRVYDYEGREVYSVKLPERCRGVHADRLGNLVLAAGELVYLAGGGQTPPLPLTTLDKSGRLFTLHAVGLAITPDGHLCTLHVNAASRRSEFVVMQMGRNMAATT